MENRYGNLDWEGDSANVIEFRFHPGNPLRHREQLRKPRDEALGLGFVKNEARLTWEHWAIGAVIVGSFVNAIISITTS
jgi:hypothetical protein